MSGPIAVAIVGLWATLVFAWLVVQLYRRDERIAALEDRLRTLRGDIADWEAANGWKAGSVQGRGDAERMIREDLNRKLADAEDWVFGAGGFLDGTGPGPIQAFIDNELEGL